jgi:uncharacterized protein YhfF
MTSDALAAADGLTDAVTAYWRKVRRDLADAAPVRPMGAFAFGDGPELADELAALVVAGTKTATASLEAAYEVEGSAPPDVGEWWVVTTWAGEPVATIVVAEVRVLPFDEVDAAFAADEGEGDLSLTYWRDAHRAFFARGCATLGLVWNETMAVVAERFRVVHRPRETGA